MPKRRIAVVTVVAAVLAAVSGCDPEKTDGGTPVTTSSVDGGDVQIGSEGACVTLDPDGQSVDC